DGGGAAAAADGAGTRLLLLRPPRRGREMPVPRLHAREGSRIRETGPQDLRFYRYHFGCRFRFPRPRLPCRDVRAASGCSAASHRAAPGVPAAGSASRSPDAPSARQLLSTVQSAVERGARLRAEIPFAQEEPCAPAHACLDRKSTRLNSSHVAISYAVF